MDLVDNVERCPQSHSLHHHQPGEFCWMEREERLRLSWIEAYRELQDAGSVCRRFGISRPTLRKWLRRFEADGAAGLCTQSRAPHRSPSTKVGPDEEALILELRRTRCLGVKRLRHELRRLLRAAAVAGDDPQNPGPARSQRAAAPQAEPTQATALQPTGAG
jgi:transposase-like protein